MTIDEWELMALEFDRLLKESTENGMTQDEFYQRWLRLQWECDELEKRQKQMENEDQGDS